MSSPSQEESISQQIDAIIKEPGDWRGEKLAQLRALILEADPDVVEEVKWKKPSKPAGVPVWVHDGNICIADTLTLAPPARAGENAVRLTFPKGAQIEDPNGLFNTRLNSKTVRAIDFYEEDNIDATALKELICAAVDQNKTSRKNK